MATNRDSGLGEENSRVSGSGGRAGGDTLPTQRRPLSASTGTRDGVSRILTKLEKRIADGEFYEAHQLYRTLYFRYVSQSKYDDAIELLMKGCLTLLDAKQTSSGADLALLIVNTLEKNKLEVTPDRLGKVVTLHRRLVNSHLERPDFVVAAMRWAKQSANNGCSSSTGLNSLQERQQLPSTASNSGSSSSTSAANNSSSAAPKTGHPGLHAKFAVTYWQERDYTQARYHFVRSDDGEGCASMLIEHHITRGFPAEVDLFIAQTVFQFLCLRNLGTAEVCFKSYTRQHPQIEAGPPFIHPLLNFIWLMLLALNSGSLSAFTALCEQYDPSLVRDASYHDYIARISQLFFHIQPPKSNRAGLFGNLLSSIFTMDEDADDDRSMLEQDDDLD